MSQRKISESVNVARSTVQEYLKRAEENQLSWEKIEKLSESEVCNLLKVPNEKVRNRSVPDYEDIKRK